MTMTLWSDEVVERVARALCRVTRVDPNKLHIDGQPRWKGWVQYARAALAAMPEPSVTDAMIADCEIIRLIAERERMLGFSGYADWLDRGCPKDDEREYPQEKIDDIRFYLRRYLAMHSISQEAGRD